MPALLAQVDPTKEDGKVCIHRFTLAWEWWGLGCVFESMRRGLVPDQSEDWCFLDEDEKAQAFRQEAERRTARWPAGTVLDMWWEFPDQTFPGNDYEAIGFILSQQNPPV